MRQHQSSRNDLRGGRLPRVPLEQVKFDSASEYACASLLEKYADWKAIPGHTFQIPIGRTVFDFRIGHCLVEYHPISLRHEFLRPESLNKILAAGKYISKQKRAELLAAVADEFKAQYIRRRGQVASAHKGYSEYELVCAFSAEEFIEKVVKRHATSATGPTIDMAKEFRTLCRSISREQRGG